MNIIHPTAIIYGNVKMGENNEIGAYCVIGDKAQVRGCNKIGHVIIGNNNRLGNFVNIDAGFRNEATLIGDDNMIMHHMHIAGDCKVGSHCNISIGACMGGRCEIQDYVFLGLGSSIHQRIRIGEGAIVGMGAVVIRDVRPWSKVVGSPSRRIGDNTIGAQRAGVTDEYIEKSIMKFYGTGTDIPEGT